MNSLPLHPLVVHMPIALSILMPLLIGLVIWGRKRSWFAPKTWLLLVLLQAIVVGSGFMSMRLGETDEDKVERFVAETQIETHEESAEVFVWSSFGVLVLLIAANFSKKTTAFQFLGLAGSLVIVFLAVQTGHSGGKLVYEYGAAQAFVPNAQVAPSNNPTDTTANPEQGDD